MPPKQKDVKKGPSYKPTTALKDIVPNEVKEPPREFKPFKIPESFPQPLKNNETLPSLFQEWPTQQTVKAYDFGVNSEVKFLDPFHPQIENYLPKQNTDQWKGMTEIQYDQEEFDNEAQQNQLNSKNQIESFKNLANNNEQGNEKPVCVIQTFMRLQNQQQMQKRLKQQAQKAEKAAKDKKKGNKKQQPKEEGPIKVSDVEMSDIITYGYMQKSAIWIGSQLQIIKQRNLKDVYSSQPVWKKIYPQQNGVPQITKSGKYWVKLLYMGRYVKIQVDDRVLINQRNRQLFPLSAKYNQKWTLILAKALIKYLAKASNDTIIGNGLIVYALTGLVSQTIPLSQFKEWEKLQDLLSNQHYEKKDVVLGCFSVNENKSFKKLTQVKVSQKQIKEGEDDDEHFQEKEVDTNILNGYSYCIGDYFDSQGFNMVFSQEKTQKQMLLKHQLNQLCKISISNKSRQEKLQYRRKKKELKQKLGIQQKKRLQLISKAPIHYHFLKLLSDLSIYCQYGEKQILLAKKCILNKLSQPPNYDFPTQKQQKDTKSLQSISISVAKYKEDSELFPNIHDFSSIANVVQLLARNDNGVWIKDMDLVQFFDNIQILYNPNIFSNKKIETVQSKVANSFTYDQNKEILVVQKNQQENELQKKVRLLFGFAYQRSINDGFTPYTIVQKFDFDSFRATSNVVTLNQDISSKLINLKNQNSVFKLYNLSKGNYNYWISCDSAYKLLSIADYLSEYQGYAKKNMIFEYPAIEANTYFPLTRLKLKQEGGQKNTILLKFANIKEEFLINLNYKIVKIQSQQSQLTSQEQQGIILRKNQTTLLAYQYSRFIIQPNYQYYLIIQAHSNQNIPDGSLELILLSKEQGLSIDQMEQVQPVKIIQKYLPNKYGVICKERLFTNSDNNATITVKLAEFQEIQAAQKGKAAKKGGKEEISTELLQKPFTGHRSIILNITNGQKILYQASGINQITIPNVKFGSTRAPSANNYNLELKFDLRVWPEASIKSTQTDKICWIAQIFSQDTLAFVRDTQQQDREKKTRKEWEDKQPGRAERAKKARRRFLIELKKQNGQLLTQEEEQIINAPRLTKKQQLEEEKKNQQKKGKGAKKDDKKTGKDAKKQQVVQEKVVQRQAPKSQDNFMNEIKQFLQILQNCSVRYELDNEGDARIRSAQQIRSIRQGAIMSIQNRVGKLIRNIQKRETVKILEKQKKQSIAVFLDQVKSQLKSKYNSYIEWRNQDIEKDKARQDKERLLIDVISQEKPNINEADLKKIIAQYREISGHNPYLAEVAEMIRKNIKIANLTDKIAGLLANWEIDQLKNIRQQIKNDKIEGINDEIMKQMKQTLQQVDKNPGIVAEKQVEAKKAKKGGKK